MSSLYGITVLDLTHALAGPFSTMLLAELGATIVKLEPPGGDHFRASGGTFASMNRNKRGIALDLKQPGSRPIMERLIKRADVFVQSFTPGTIERLGYDYERVANLNPQVIYCSISGFGDTGPYRELRGYDTVIQAMSGIMAHTGEPDRPPVRVGPSLIDMGTGMYLVIGILNALRERDKNGEGSRLEFNLLETALSWMAPSIAEYSITGEVPSRNGSALATFSPYQIFPASDGYLFIGVSTQRIWLRFCAAIGRDELIQDDRFIDMPARVKNRDALTEIIEQYLADTTVPDIVTKLRRAGIPCAPVSSVDEIVSDPHVQARGVLSAHQDPQAGEVLQVRSPIGHDTNELRPAPGFSQHTAQVLAELELSEAEIAKLFEDGVALSPSADG